MSHTQDHDFHVPKPSIWPPVSCLGAGLMAFAFVMMAATKSADMPWGALYAQITMVVGLLTLILGAGKWWGMLIKESRERGYDKVPKVLDLANRYGMVFFIASEVMFFAAFFIAYFYASTFNIVWPPSSIEVLSIELPVINTLLLLSSGATISWAHHALIKGDRKTLVRYTLLTAVLGFIFLGLQMLEYSHAAFAFDSGIYGSAFYLLTGFHGFHVFVGSVMLLVLYKRLKKGDFSQKHHFYFEGAAWYWHFVDVVWIGLFLFVYAL